MDQVDSNISSASNTFNKVHGIIFIVVAVGFLLFYWPYYSIYGMLISKIAVTILYLCFGLFLLKTKTKKTIFITMLWIGIIVILLFYPREAGGGGDMYQQDCKCLGFMYEPIRIAPARVLCAGIPHSCTTYYDQSNDTQISTLTKDQCPCWDGVNNICLPQSSCI